MSGFDNETVYATNWDFRGVQPVLPQVSLSGQLPIGTGASPAILVGKLISPNSTITIGYSSPNITLDIAGINPTPFTPVLRFGGASVGITYTTQKGFYMTVGKLVTVWIEILLSSKGISTGAATISGIPFPVGLGSPTVSPFFMIEALVTNPPGTPCASISSGSSILGLFFDNYTDAALPALDDTSFDNVSFFHISFSYFRD